MHAFSYHRPRSLEDAVKLLSAAEDAKLLAGGMTLIPTMKQRLAAPSTIVDLSRIPSLTGIAIEGDDVVIGAMTWHVMVQRSPELMAKLPALAHLAGGIGDPAVRNRGTLGGSISNADPAADYPSALVALKATVITDQRSVNADEFFTGMFETALLRNEIVRQVRFRIPQAAAYAKFPNPASRYAVVGVFVARYQEGVRLAVTGAGPSVFRIAEMETALSADFTPDAIASVTVPANNLNSDPHATAEYRAHLIGVMARRAVAAAR